MYVWNMKNPSKGFGQSIEGKATTRAVKETYIIKVFIANKKPLHMQGF